MRRNRHTEREQLGSMVSALGTTLHRCFPGLEWQTQTIVTATENVGRIDAAHREFWDERKPEHYVVRGMRHVEDMLSHLGDDLKHPGSHKWRKKVQKREWALDGLLAAFLPGWDDACAYHWDLSGSIQGQHSFKLPHGTSYKAAVAYAKAERKRIRAAEGRR